MKNLKLILLSVLTALSLTSCGMDGNVTSSPSPTSDTGSVSQDLKDVGDDAGNAVKDVGDAAGDAVEGVGDAAGDIVDGVDDTVEEH